MAVCWQTETVDLMNCAPRREHNSTRSQTDYSSNKSINQLVNQSINQSINQPTNKPTDWSIIQSIDQWSKQSDDQSIRPSINQLKIKGKWMISYEPDKWWCFKSDFVEVKLWTNIGCRLHLFQLQQTAQLYQSTSIRHDHFTFTANNGKQQVSAYISASAQWPEGKLCCMLFVAALQIFNVNYTMSKKRPSFYLSNNSVKN